MNKPESNEAAERASGSLKRMVHGKTAQQWHDAWLLCATGRELEWEQLCYLTDKLARTARFLRRAGDKGNGAAAWAADKLSEATQYLWLCDAEKCEHKMPDSYRESGIAFADPGETHPPNS